MACLGNVDSPVEQAQPPYPTVHSAEAAFCKVVPSWKAGNPGGQGLCQFHFLQCVSGQEQCLVTSWCSINVC